MSDATFYLLRHGETVWNREGRLQGQRDSPLTARGIAQAGALGDLLGREIAEPRRFTIVASPLGRAWQSAVIVAERLGLDPRHIAFDGRLKECGFGAWEGKTPEELEPGAWARREADRWNYRSPGGESCALVAERIAAWLAEVPPDARWIVVGHGLAGRIIRGLYAGLDEAEIPQLAEPQEALYRLRGGRVEELAATAGLDSSRNPHPSTGSG